MDGFDSICVDLKHGKVVVKAGENSTILDLESAEAFSAISHTWLRCGWDTKYVYSFTWLGRPIIQLPEDMFRIQELIYSIKPDVVIETGIAHGGSLVFYASICKAMGKGRVIGVDVEIRPHNRKAIEAHELFEYITLLEGSSVSEEVFTEVKQLIKSSESVIVILDSNHSKQHVLRELYLYSSLVSVNSYIVACDGIMAFLGNAPRTQADWHENNPLAAVQEFLQNRNNFVAEEPTFPFNESLIKERVTYWPAGFLKRVK